MVSLAALARAHDAFVPSDSEDQRQARLLRALWREAQSYPIGEHQGYPLGSRLAMPWAEETLANYLTDGIRAVVRRDLAAAQGGQVFNLARTSAPRDAPLPYRDGARRGWEGHRPDPRGERNPLD